MKLFRALMTGTLLSVVASSAWAVGSFDPTKIADQATFDALTKDLGAATSYKALSPTEPLGLLGFDIGLEVTGTSLQSIDQWGDAIGDTGLSMLPFPKIHAHKGLPLGIDLGLVYSQYPSTDISYVGGEIRYSFVSGNTAIPSIGVRGTYSKVYSVDEMDMSSTGVELTISKGFLMLTPYGGIGNVWTSGELAYNDPILGDIKFDSNPSMFKWFVGLNLNLALINFAFEMDKTGDAASYSGKVGFRF